MSLAPATTDIRTRPGCWYSCQYSQSAKRRLVLPARSGTWRWCFQNSDRWHLWLTFRRRWLPIGILVHPHTGSCIADHRPHQGTAGKGMRRTQRDKSRKLDHTPRIGCSLSGGGGDWLQRGILTLGMLMVVWNVMVGVDVFRTIRNLTTIIRKAILSRENTIWPCWTNLRKNLLFMSHPYSANLWVWGGVKCQSHPW